MKLDPGKMRLLALALFPPAVFALGVGIWDFIVGDTFGWALVLPAVTFLGAGVALLITAKPVEHRR